MSLKQVQYRQIYRLFTQYQNCLMQKYPKWGFSSCFYRVFAMMKILTRLHNCYARCPKIDVV